MLDIVEHIQDPNNDLIKSHERHDVIVMQNEEKGHV